MGMRRRKNVYVLEVGINGDGHVSGALGRLQNKDPTLYSSTMSIAKNFVFRRLPASEQYETVVRYEWELIEAKKRGETIEKYSEVTNKKIADKFLGAIRRIDGVEDVVEQARGEYFEYYKQYTEVTNFSKLLEAYGGAKLMRVLDQLAEQIKKLSTFPNFSNSEYLRRLRAVMKALDKGSEKFYKKKWKILKIPADLYIPVEGWEDDNFSAYVFREAMINYLVSESKKKREDVEKFWKAVWKKLS